MMDTGNKYAHKPGPPEMGVVPDRAKAPTITSGIRSTLIADRGLHQISESGVVNRNKIISGILMICKNLEIFDASEKSSSSGFITFRKSFITLFTVTAPVVAIIGGAATKISIYLIFYNSLEKSY